MGKYGQGRSDIKNALADWGIGSAQQPQEPTKPKPLIDFSSIQPSKEDKQQSADSSVENAFMTGAPAPAPTSFETQDTGSETSFSGTNEASDISTDVPEGVDTTEVPKETPSASLSDRYDNRIKELNEEAKTIGPELYNAVNQAKAVYQTNSDKLAAKQMWEGIIHGIAHLAAGAIGHQTGMNLGGLKFDKQNWDRKQEMLARTLESSKNDAYRKMSLDQQKLADKRSQAAEGYKISKGELEYADIKQNREDKLDIERKKLGIAKKKANRDIIKAIQEGQEDKKKQYLKEYNNMRSGINSALKSYMEDPNSDKAGDLNRRVNEARERGKALGLETGLPDKFDATAKNWYGGESYKDFIAVNDIMAGDKAVGPTQEEDPQIAEYAATNGITYQQAYNIIQRRKSQ